MKGYNNKTHEDGSILRADSIIKQIPAGIAILAVNTSISIKNANDEFYHILGYKDEQDFMINNGEDIHSLISESDYEYLKKAFGKSSGRFETYDYRLKMRRPITGESIHILLRYRYMEHTAETALFQVSISDITRNFDLEKDGGFSGLRRPGHITEEFSFTYDVGEDVLTVPMESFLGQQHDTVLSGFITDRKWEVYIPEKERLKVEASMKNAMEWPNTGEFVIQSRTSSDKHSQWFKIYYKNDAAPDGKATKVMGRVVDITDLREMDYKVSRGISNDPVTGFYNYKTFSGKVKELLEDDVTKRSYIIVLSINNFDLISTEFGTAFTDAVIQNVSVKMFKLVRESDLCCRLDKQTFAIWFRNIEPDIVSAKAKELCNAISSVYSGERDINILSCAGISDNDGHLSFEDMLLQAYSAMKYASKQENKCTVLYRENMPLVDMKTDNFENDLYYRIKNHDVELLSFAFGLLVNSRDLISSSNLLLERIGERYNLDDIVVTEIDWMNECQTVKNHWSRKHGHRPPYELPEDADRLLRGDNYSVDERGMFTFNDDVDEEWAMTFKKCGYKIKSMIGCPYYVSEELAGFIGFIDENHKRDWSDYIVSTFREIASIMTVFISIDNNRQRDQNTIKELSSRDKLTGLYNMSEFRKRALELAGNLGEDDKLVLLFTDINNFAYINDSYGQVAGDSLLRDFGKYLKKRDNISCRVYSDYFITIGIVRPGNLEYSSVIRANRKFERLTKEKFPLSNIRLSTGLFTFRPGECDIDTAIDNANMARKACKQDGNLGCVVYDESMRRIRENEQKFVGGLQDAIQNGEFRLYLQPKFRMDTKEVIGAEALSRWITSDGVVHYPDEFIPMFEKKGQIVQVDFFIYEQVLNFMKKWKMSGKDLIPISVNFSRLNVCHENFVDELDKLASYYDIEPSMIEVEITESAISTGNDEMINVLGELRSYGFVVDMDDFGRGLSSLNMLLNAPIDIVKVDKDFLSNTLDGRGKKYIEHVGGLINAADKDIIFEGVENEEQAEFLLECGYKKAQGFLFDTPMEAGEFEKKYIYSS
ncbi:MAG: EAL domain-containing protein [Lachnospiraceae bacterium]|nr:EAL domain-containing protein [Lachnospiraceae bacterium]